MRLTADETGKVTVKKREIKVQCQRIDSYLKLWSSSRLHSYHFNAVSQYTNHQSFNLTTTSLPSLPGFLSSPLLLLAGTAPKMLPALSLIRLSITVCCSRIAVISPSFLEILSML